MYTGLEVWENGARTSVDLWGIDPGVLCPPGKPEAAHLPDSALMGKGYLGPSVFRIPLEPWHSGIFQNHCEFTHWFHRLWMLELGEASRDAAPGHLTHPGN